MTTRSREFYDFMKKVAEKHRLLNHTAADPHFFRGELEEFYIGLRNRVNFPALIVEGFGLSYGDTKTRSTSFIIAQGYREQNDYDEIEENYDFCERIGDEIIRYLTEEFSPCAAIADISAAQLENETEKYCGIRYTFDIEMPFKQTLNPEERH